LKKRKELLLRPRRKNRSQGPLPVAHRKRTSAILAGKGPFNCYPTGCLGLGQTTLAGGVVEGGGKKTSNLGKTGSKGSCLGLPPSRFVVSSGGFVECVGAEAMRNSGGRGMEGRNGPPNQSKKSDRGKRKKKKTPAR